MGPNDTNCNCNHCCRDHRCNLLNVYVVLAVITVYALNTFIGKPNFSVQFLHCYLNDLFAMPLILAYTNLLFCWVGKRSPAFTTPLQIAFLTLFCSIIWEGLAPSILQHSSRDPWDVVAYMIGGFSYFILVSVADWRSRILLARSE